MSTPQITNVKIIAPINKVMAMVSFRSDRSPPSAAELRKCYRGGDRTPVMHRTPATAPPKLTAPANEER